MIQLHRHLLSIEKRSHTFAEWWTSSRRDALSLSAILVAIIGLWSFIALVEDVRTGRTQHLDTSTMQWLEQWHGTGFVFLEEAGHDFAGLGGMPVLGLVTAAGIVFFLVLRRFGEAMLAVITIGGGLALAFALKTLMERPRPWEIASDHLSIAHPSSFPSGHSMMATIVYLTLASLLARYVHRRGHSRAVSVYFILLALMLTFLVGVGQVYRKAHWPTDVLAGWAAGVAWTVPCCLKRMRGRSS